MDVSATNIYHITNFCWIYSNHPQIDQCHKLCLNLVCHREKIIILGAFSSKQKLTYTTITHTERHITEGKSSSHSLEGN